MIQEHINFLKRLERDLIDLDYKAEITKYHSVFKKEAFTTTLCVITIEYDYDHPVVVAKLNAGMISISESYLVALLADNPYSIESIIRQMIIDMYRKQACKAITALL